MTKKDLSMNKERPKVHWIGVLSVLVILGSLVGNYVSNRKTNSLHMDIESAPIEDYIRWVVKDKIGKANIDEYDVVQGVQLSGDILLLRLVTTSVSESLLGWDSACILQPIFDDRSEVNEVHLIWLVPIIDRHGNNTLDSIAKLRLSRSTANKLNWKNLFLLNAKQWSDYWETNQRWIEK